MFIASYCFSEWEAVPAGGPTGDETGPLAVPYHDK